MSAPADTSRPSGHARAKRRGMRAGRCSARERCPLGRLHPVRTADWQRADAVLAVGLLAAVVIVGNLRQYAPGPGGVSGNASFREERTAHRRVRVGLAPGAVGVRAVRAAPPAHGEGEWPRLAAAGAVGCALAMVFPLTSRSGDVTPLHALLFGVAIVPAAGLFRASVRAVERKRSSTRPRQVLLVGSGPHAAAAVPAAHLGPAPDQQRHRLRGLGAAARTWRETGWRTWAGLRTSSRC